MAKTRLSLYYLVPGRDLNILGERMIAVNGALKALQQKYGLGGEEPNLTRFDCYDSIHVELIQDQEVVRQTLEELVESGELIPDIVDAPGSLWWTGRRKEEDRGVETAQEVLGSVGCSLKPVYNDFHRLPVLGYLRYYFVE